jgi:nicotinate phosphoribosyltransferase
MTTNKGIKMNLELIERIEADQKSLISKAKLQFGEDFEPIILFLSDTDLYKMTMQQVVLHQFPHARDVEFRFRCRTKGVDLAQYIDEINRQLDWVCTLTYQPYELDFMSKLRYIKPDYVDFLNLFRLQRKYLTVEKLENNEIDIVCRGPWLHTIPFEIYCLSIVNEIYFRSTQNEDVFTEGRRRLAEKTSLIKALNDDNYKISDFGTRRRYSNVWQDEVVRTLSVEIPDNFSGTSNVLFAMKYDLIPIGTMAHEYLQAAQALGPRLRDSQKFALEVWVKEYRGDLGIALTDVVGLDAFLVDFDLYFCKLFDGLRHDSGCPYEWTEKVLDHYRKMKIDTKTKSLVYSDGLTVPKAIALYEKYKDSAKLFFGIGTNLTNDLGPTSINIVMKMVSCNGSPVAKISDSEGKTMCKDDKFLEYLKETFKIK